MKRVFSFILVSVCIVLSLVLPGCEVDYYQGNEENKESVPSLFEGDVVIPSGFDWATMRTIDINVAVDDRYNGQYYYVVELFDGNPLFDKEATLLSKGVAKKGQEYRVSLSIPSAIDILWIRQTDPTGKRMIMAKDLTADFGPEFSFGGARSAAFRSASSMEVSPSSFTSMNADRQDSYPTPKDDVIVIDNMESPVEIGPAYYPVAKHQSFVIKKGYTGEIKFNGGGLGASLYIEGKWINTSSNTIKIGENEKLILQSGGEVSTENDFSISGNGGALFFVSKGAIFNQSNKKVSISTNNKEGKIINHGVLKANEMSIPSAGELYNSGDLELTSLTANSSSVITNNGNLTIAAAFSMPSNGELHNWGKVQLSTIVAGSSVIKNYRTFEVASEAKFNSGAKVFNYCHFISPKVTSDGAEITVGKESLFSTEKLISGGTTFILEDHAMLEVKENANFSSWTSTIKGADGNKEFALARLKKVISGNSDTGGIIYSGNVEVECSEYDQNPQYNKYYSLHKPARMVEEGQSTIIIPGTECNGGGNNPNPGKPIDPQFPIDVEGTSVTYLFEDNWPSLGDYDMNDMVLDVKPAYVKNKENKVLQLKMSVLLRAAGATKHLAAGIQLDGITVDNVRRLERSNDKGIINGKVKVFEQKNGLEKEQKMAVIPLFDDVHAALGQPSPVFINTLKGENAAVVSPLEVDFTIDFAKPVDEGDIKFNVFIVNGGYKDERQEVHLAGFSATDKANTDRFGYADSASETEPYKSKQKLMWALAIPGEGKYPQEWTKISVAYPKMQNWAMSGGTEDKDWYDHPDKNKVYGQ